MAKDELDGAIEGAFSDDGGQEEKTSHMVIGVLPCYSTFVTLGWGFIKEICEEFVGLSMNEYSSYEVWQAIFYGRAQLYMGFEHDEDLPQEKQGEVVMKNIMEKNKDKFIGYFVIRMDDKAIHVWQAHIEPKHRNTGVFRRAFEYLEGQARLIKAPYITFASHRKDWAPIAKRFGFSETFVNYRKELN